MGVIKNWHKAHWWREADTFFCVQLGKGLADRFQKSLCTLGKSVLVWCERCRVLSVAASGTARNCTRSNMSEAITHTAAGSLVAWGTGEQWPFHVSFSLLQMWPSHTPAYYLSLLHWPSQTNHRNWCMGLPPFWVVVKFGAWRMGEIICIWGAQEHDSLWFLWQSRFTKHAVCEQKEWINPGLG